MSSPIQDFYKNKIIFITGGSGFVGKVTIEKLLRSTDLKRIYVLIRPKKDQNVQDRIAAWKEDIVFSELLKSDPEGLKRIAPISGDCKLADLGISKEDRHLLAQEVQVVMHGAATVRFTEPLHYALDINTRATRLVMALAKEMIRLEAFVHISTAFSNCVIDNINESFYPEHLSCSADKVLALRETLGEDGIDRVASVLIGKFPNTYTYTKALAEQVVQDEAGDLPLCIYRPAIIIGGYKEPFDGWIGNTYGPTQLVYCTALGLVRVARLNGKAKANLLPVDYCVNLLLAVAWRTAVEEGIRRKKAIATPDLTIYNYVPMESNVLTWGDFRDKTTALTRSVFPFEKMMWLPILHFAPTKWSFHLLAFFYHIIPAYLMDVSLRLKGEKTKFLAQYKRLHNTVHILSLFGLNNWHFKTCNTENLWDSMTPMDQKIFHFDMKALDWDDYFNRSIAGIRVYLAKEDPSPEGIERSRRIGKRYYKLHRLLQLVLGCLALAILWFGLKFLLKFF